MSFKLRPYQQVCVDELLKDYKDNSRLGAVLPTASGKTEIFIELSKRFLDLEPDKLVLILSHLSLLTVQTKKRFEKRYPDIRTGVLQADRKPHRHDDVVISTMQTSRKEPKVKYGLEKDVALIIVDEMHYLQTPSYDSVISYFPDAKLLGVTATPYRANQLMTDYFDKVSFTISMRELIEQGYLVQPKLNQIIMDNEAEAPERIARVVDLYQRGEMGKKAIVYMQTIEDAKLARNAFVNAGIKAHAITCELTGKKRDEILEEYENTDLNVLTTVNVLSMGFDSPKTECLFMPYSTGSVVMFLQRMGRAMRLCPEINKVECRLYMFGNAPSIRRGKYLRLIDMALNEGESAVEPDIHTELEYLELLSDDERGAVYEWTKKVAEISTELKALKLHGLHELMRKKKFPKRYLNNLSMIKEGMPSEPAKGDCLEAPTAYQINRLKTVGFNLDQVNEMSKADAAVMLEITSKIRESSRSNPDTKWIVPSGKHMGKHVKNLSYAYKRIVLQKFPNSFVGKLISEWNRRDK